MIGRVIIHENHYYYEVPGRLVKPLLLLHSISGIYAETAKGKDFTAIFNGAVAKQFAGQEFLAYKNPFTKAKAYYWAREAKNSNAEIDYIIDIRSVLFPIEIKSGAKGRMKSLVMFLEKYKPQRGIKISQAPYDANEQILSLPFYAIERLFTNK